jgi:hypothetical protein
MSPYLLQSKRLCAVLKKVPRQSVSKRVCAVLAEYVQMLHLNGLELLRSNILDSNGDEDGAMYQSPASIFSACMLTFSR